VAGYRRPPLPIVTDATTATPLVSALVATRDAAPTLRTALTSLLRQRFAGELELIVVDDGSTDETVGVLEGIEDERLVVLRNETSLGLAASLNLGLEQARGRYVARLDADDVALPGRLARQLEAIAMLPGLAVLGTGILELEESGHVGRLHQLPGGRLAVRWHALFRTPFFHPSVLLDRDLLDEHGLRYDETVGAAQDFELWTRVLAIADGANLPEPLVLRRLHAGQVSRLHNDAQRERLATVAAPGLAALAPELAPDVRELAWRVGAGVEVPSGESEGAVDAFGHVLQAFERLHGVDADVRSLAARSLARFGAAGKRQAASLHPTFAADVVADRLRRGRLARQATPAAGAWLRAIDRDPEAPLRVVVVQPEPTPYRSPLFDRIAAREEIDLTVIYAAETVIDRSWSVEHEHSSLFLKGVRIPGARPLIRHDYPVTPGIASALKRLRPDVVVVTGWSMFASQAAIAWARRNGVPYLLLVSSHDAGPKPGWRRAVKSTVVPRVVRPAAGALVLGSLAASSLVAHGLAPEKIWRFANTIDVVDWGRHVDALAPLRDEIRGSLGAGRDSVIVLSVGRLSPEKGLDTLIDALATIGDPRVRLVVAGTGDERQALEKRAVAAGLTTTFLGAVPWEQLREVYVASDVFALLSRHEPWGVVVNEAAATGLPLVLSDRVGAAHDLVREGENGFVVPADDPLAAAAALRPLVVDAKLRRAVGDTARVLIADWGYEPSVESFVAAVRAATVPA
jgi:glycosyltransferase involved in cell wall biosynthesis